MIWIQRIHAECVDRIHIYHIFQILIIPCLNFLNLMGGTETVEEVDKRNFPLQCRTVCNRSQVHNFLYAGLAKHRTACLTARVYIGMISENRQCMALQAHERIR